MKKKTMCLILAIVLCISLLPTAALAAPTAGLDNFKIIRTYTDGRFTDVKEDKWFSENVASAFELALMVGKRENFFDTESNLTVAEAMTIAARLHSIYYTGKADFVQSKPWYQVYTDYCKANGIADPAVYDLGTPITRGQFADMYANAFPAEALKKINTVQDNAIPDVKTTDPFGKAIYMLYRAGVLIGNDEKGTFAPDSYIRRVEVAAITTRMAQPALRQSIKLVNQSYDPGIYYPPIYTISYKDEGDADFSGTHEGIAPNTHTYGIATMLKRAAKSGNYAFGGWYTTSDCSGSAVTSLGATDYTANITLYAKWIDTTGFTFKAVYDTTDGANTLTFYYDSLPHIGDNIAVYDSLPTAATYASDWGYNGVRSEVKCAVIDESVQYYTGLTSTAYMFSGMVNAESITGAELLYTAAVTDMSGMFQLYGQASTVLNQVPDVSEWNTAKATNMSGMFFFYGGNSAALNQVPDVSGWNTAAVTDMSNLFGNYGSSSTCLTAVPDVSKWNTAVVTNMKFMFANYGFSSTCLTAVPDVSKWNTANVTDMGRLFHYYGFSSTCLTAAPDVSKWNTAAVTDMSHMFESYGSKSTDLTAVPDVSKWNTAAVTNMESMFRQYGQTSTALTAVPDVSKWNTAAVTNIGGMFVSYGQTSAVLNFTLNLSGWNLESVTTVEDPIMGTSGWKVFNYAGYKAPVWSVTIPAKTGETPNTQSAWYVGDGTKFIAPAADKTFSFPATEVE